MNKQANRFVSWSRHGLMNYYKIEKKKKRKILNCVDPEAFRRRVGTAQSHREGGPHCGTPPQPRYQRAVSPVGMALQMYQVWFQSAELSSNCGLSWFYSVPLSQISGQGLELGHDHFLPNSFQFMKLPAVYGTGSSLLCYQRGPANSFLRS